MLAFQREPDHQDKPSRCERCHETLVTKLTSESDPYCTACGHVLGTSVQPAVWTCEECGEITLGLKDHDEHPWCDDCRVPLSCLSAQPSRIHGAETGDEDMDLGRSILVEAQEAELELGSDLLKDSQS